MVYSFARVGATVTMKVGHYFEHRQRWWLRGCARRMASLRGSQASAAAEYLRAWLVTAGIARDKNGPLFRSVGKGDRLGEKAMSRFDVLYKGRRPALVS